MRVLCMHATVLNHCLPQVIERLEQEEDINQVSVLFTSHSLAHSSIHSHVHLFTGSVIHSLTHPFTHKHPSPIHRFWTFSVTNISMSSTVSSGNSTRTTTSSSARATWEPTIIEVAG